MKALLVLALVTIGASAHAFDRSRATCSQLQSLVASRGAVVIHYGDGLYQRFVSTGSYCATGEYAKQTYIPAADTQTCLLYYCQSEDRGGIQ
jgi:hypothetical protein